MNNKIIFIIGLRRSGTSILRSLINTHSEVEDLLFEPHELLFCASTLHLARYQKSEYHNAVLNSFRNRSKYYGAKVAINVGVEAGKWNHIIRRFPEAKIIFTKRNAQDNYSSWLREDTKTVHHTFDFKTYHTLWEVCNKEFEAYHIKNPDKSCIINYEGLVQDADGELSKAWNVLGIDPLTGMQTFIKKPQSWSLKS